MKQWRETTRLEWVLRTAFILLLTIFGLTYAYHIPYEIGAAYERGLVECEHRVDTVYDTVIIYADSAYMDGYIDGVWDAFASQYNLPRTFDTLTVRR